LEAHKIKTVFQNPVSMTKHTVRISIVTASQLMLLVEIFAAYYEKRTVLKVKKSGINVFHCALNIVTWCDYTGGLDL
jgi:hypothetical protein